MNIGSKEIFEETEASLPYDTELQWIQSDSKSFVDTRIVPNPSDTFGMFGTVIIGQKGNQIIFGVRQDSTNSRFTVGTSANQMYVGRGSPDGIGPNFICSENDTVSFKYNKLNSRRLEWMNETTNTEAQYDITSQFDIQFSRSIWALKGNWIGGFLDSDSGVQVRSFGITDRSTVVFDAIPVKKDGVGYLYDRISKQLFGNAGTGTFILGPDVK